MGLFDKIKEPIFLKEESNAQKQLAALQTLREQATGETVAKLDEEISRVNAGIYGENAIHFELANSHIPMYVLHDLYLEHDGLTAQIDYLLVTRKHVYVIECKNLYGNIEINNAGDFMRTVHYGQRAHKEGIYSPITQNRRHLELIKAMRGAEKTNVLTKALFENSFYNAYRSIVVLANPKTVLYDRYAKKEVKNQVIRADQLTEYIRTTDRSADASISEKEMENLAQYFLSHHQEHTVDYTAKYREEMETAQASQQNTEQQAPAEQPSEQPIEKSASAEKIICPRCGAAMIKRKAAKGAYAGKEFYGCSNYPKCHCIINIK